MGIATGSADKNVKLWSTQFGNCHKSLRAHDDSVMHVRFLPDTHYLVSTGRDRQVKLWDCDAYTMILSLSGHASEVLALAISKDAAFIITGGSDRQIRFWRRRVRWYPCEHRGVRLRASRAPKISLKSWTQPSRKGRHQKCRAFEWYVT